ncbi:hypothetical protein ACVWW2_002240 [Bradyrhizobium sp. LM4.3]
MWPTEWTRRTASSGIHGIGDDGVMAFTDFGIENLMELIRMHKEDAELLRRLNR